MSDSAATGRERSDMSGSAATGAEGRGNAMSGVAATGAGAGGRTP